ncbi:MAG: preprotein translocase subunit YajC [Lachnospiraceae bacterium]|nr:preprotein translocase subunit YajC [Lachnospiraceae bacterium]MEE3460872.1 preprotein translocase subunit YajC [Lachnospiraceae bacterium]
MNLMSTFLASASSNTGAATAGGTIGMIVMWAAIIAIFYFILIRPQKKQQKEHDTLVAQLEVGDSVLTSSGFYGVIIAMEDDVCVVEFGSNKNCRIPMRKENVVEVQKPGEEAKQETKPEKKEEKKPAIKK